MVAKVIPGCKYRKNNLDETDSPIKWCIVGGKLKQMIRRMRCGEIHDVDENKTTKLVENRKKLRQLR